jgi:hypothetical protein
MEMGWGLILCLFLKIKKNKKTLKINNVNSDRQNIISGDKNADSLFFPPNISVAWPPGSPYLGPCGYLKSIVFLFSFLYLGEKPLSWSSWLSKIYCFPVLFFIFKGKSPLSSFNDCSIVNIFHKV